MCYSDGLMINGTAGQSILSGRYRTALDPFEKIDRHSPMPFGGSSGNTTAAAAATRARSLLKPAVLITLLLSLCYLFLPVPSVQIAQQYSSNTPQSYTSVCSQSADPSKPIVQYVLMIDAGSTGSRIHIYKFHNCNQVPVLESEVFEHTEPGLSSFKDDAEGAARSLDGLLHIALDTVPEALQSSTPVAVKATAGLRLLGPALADAILRAVHRRLESEYPFSLPDRDAVVIMDGKDEGVYAWITTNYLLGYIGSDKLSATAATFDLGGGSTQIVFEPTFPADVHMEEGDHKYKLSYAGREFLLYQHSHLGYGLMEARKAIHRHVVSQALAASAAPAALSTLPHPCIPRGMSTKVMVDGRPYTMIGTEDHDAHQCRMLADRILNKTAECAVVPCSFNGIHQPSLAQTLSPGSDIYVFSYFYDRTAPLGLPSEFSIGELMDLANVVCGGDGWSTQFNSAAIEALRAEPQWCLDLNFITSLLSAGYEMPMERRVKIAKKINGNELGWCLGASLPFLEQTEWKPRVKELNA